jgi:pimeloyl-ACP methyl ester carboxylesterase
MNWPTLTALVLGCVLGAVLVGSLGVIARRAWRAAYLTYHPFAAVERPAPKRPAAVPPADDAVLRSSLDGTPLAVSFFPGRGPHTVVAAHPLTCDRSWLAGHVRALHQAGFHIATYDQRNHGESGDDPTTFRRSRATQRDLEDVIRWAAERPESRGGRIGVLAFSFSSWAAFVSATRPDLVDAVVCDSGPVLDLGRAFARRFDMARRLLPRYLRAGMPYRLLGFTYRLCAVLMLGARDWPPPVDRIRVPVLIITGEGDRLVPSAEVRAAAERYPRAQLWAVPGAKHNQALRARPEEYPARVAGFFDSAFAPGRAPAQTRRDG